MNKTPKDFQKLQDLATPVFLSGVTMTSTLWKSPVQVVMFTCIMYEAYYKAWDEQVALEARSAGIYLIS